MSEKEINQTISRNLQKYLDKNNRTQQELAEFMGVSQATVSNWCKGIKMPRMSKVDMICDFLGINRSDLLNEETSGVYALSDRERSHILTYRTLSPYGKDRVDTYTERISELEKQDEDSDIIEQFQKRFVARNGKSISPDRMQMIMDIIDGD